MSDKTKIPRRNPDAPAPDRVDGCLSILQGLIGLGMIAAIAVGGASASVPSGVTSFIAKHGGPAQVPDPYLTPEELSQKTGHRIVIMTEVGDKEFTRNFCWALGLPSRLDENSLGGVGCVVDGVLGGDLDNATMSESEQTGYCKSPEVGGKFEYVTLDPKNPADINFVAAACQTRDSA